MSDLKIGQKVWLVKIGNLARRGQPEPEEVTVSKVGRKYFEVAELHGRAKFDLDSMTEVSDYSPSYCIYLILQDYLDTKEANQIYDELHKHFGNYGRTKFPLEKLRKIKEIINQ